MGEDVPETDAEAAERVIKFHELPELVEFPLLGFDSVKEAWELCKVNYRELYEQAKKCARRIDRGREDDPVKYDQAKERMRRLSIVSPNYQGMIVPPGATDWNAVKYCPAVPPVYMGGATGKEGNPDRNEKYRKPNGGKPLEGMCNYCFCNPPPPGTDRSQEGWATRGAPRSNHRATDCTRVKFAIFQMRMWELLWEKMSPEMAAAQDRRREERGNGKGTGGGPRERGGARGGEPRGRG